MKFEIGGLYDKNNDDDDHIPVDAQYDSFIEQITGKDGRYSISSSIEGIENQKNEKGRSGLHDDMDRGRDIILDKVDSQNNDSGIGIELDRSRMSSTEEEHDGTGEQKLGSGVMAKELQDGECVDKAEIYGETEPSTPIQPKRRMSDLDAHLRMMNDKASRFFQPNPEEYPEIDGPDNVSEQKREDIVQFNANVDNTEQNKDDKLSLKQDSHIENKETYDRGAKPIIDTDIDNSNTVGVFDSQFGKTTEKGDEQPTKGKTKNNYEEMETSEERQHTSEQENSDNAEVKEKDNEDVDLLDDMLDFLTNNRKGSRRSMTTDSGLGDDDYR